MCDAGPSAYWLTRRPSCKVNVASPPSSRFNLSYRVELSLLLSPYVLGALLLIGAPAVLTTVLAFMFYDALSRPVWVGWANFYEIFADPQFAIARLNTLYYIGLAVPARVLGALGLALLLNAPRRGAGFYRAGIYLPTVIPDTAYALVFMWIFNPLYGPVNLTLKALGLPTPGWLADTETAKLVFVIMGTFQIGEGFVVLLTGLRNIPRDYYDSAAVDGGNAWQVFRYITLPLLSPWLILLTFRDVILSFQNIFTPVFMMTGGGPYYSTLFLPLLIYEEAFDRFHFGPASAMMLIMFIAAASLIGILLVLFEEAGYVEESHE